MVEAAGTGCQCPVVYSQVDKQTHRKLRTLVAQDDAAIRNPVTDLTGLEIGLLSSFGED